MKRRVNVSILILILAILTFLGCPDKDIFTPMVTINNLNFSSDTRINIALHENPITNIRVYEGIYLEVGGVGFTENGSVTIELIRQDDETQWQPSGSWYVLFLAESRCYISENPVNFKSNPQPILDFSLFKQVAFAYSVDELFNLPPNITGITLDELLYILTSGESSYSKMMEGYNFQFYKDPDSTQPFSGDDIVDTNTVFYTPFLIFNGGSDL